jgi:hypothetical protein
MKPKSRFQAYVLFLVYLIVLFFFGGVLSNFLGAIALYFKYDTWHFGWADISGVFPGFLAYAVPVWFGICLASYFKWGGGK